jgi:hypothetical protein
MPSSETSAMSLSAIGAIRAGSTSQLLQQRLRLL